MAAAGCCVERTTAAAAADIAWPASSSARGSAALGRQRAAQAETQDEQAQAPQAPEEEQGQHQVMELSWTLASRVHCRARIAAACEQETVYVRLLYADAGSSVSANE